MEQGLLDKTGKPLEHWISVVKEAKLEKHKEILDFLISQHKFTHGFANFVSLKARESDAASIDDSQLLEKQYQGKENLKPIYDLLIEIVSKFGDDISIVPKKDSVSLRRKYQFALIKPATKTRIDLGLKIKGKDISERLESSGPFGTMCTHRVKIAETGEIDQELINWLKEAYEKAA